MKTLTGACSPETEAVPVLDRRSDGDAAHRWSADDALTHLYAAHWRALVRLSWLLLHDAQQAEEVVQDAFVAMHRRWGRLDDPDKALAYLRVCVVNGSRSALRRRGVEARWTRSGGPTSASPAPRRVDEPVRSAEDGAIAAQDRAAVQQLVRELATRQREVLVLRYYLDLSEAQIAQTLGISTGAVKSHAHRGLAALKVALTTLHAANGDHDPDLDMEGRR
jgi:RNA polymerase sigma-70 factor (sigma-E family)